MATTVLLAARAPFLLMAMGQMLKEAPEIKIALEVRDAPDAASALANQSIDVALIEAGLLEEPAGAALLAVLRQRSAPTLLIDATGSFQNSLQSLGSLMVLAPPAPDGSSNLGTIKTQLLPNLRRMVEEWRIAAPALPRQQRIPVNASVSPASIANPVATARRGVEVILIGASTGGPVALLAILKQLRTISLPIIIAQHMPADQTASFAHHLSQETGFTVIERGAGIMPADQSITVLRGGKDYRIGRSQEGGFLLRHAPSSDNPFHPGVDVLFRSAAEAGLAAAAVVLTGMGQDGAEGALALRLAGAPVIVQTSESCVVPGMPNAAIAVGAASEILGLARIAERIADWMQGEPERHLLIRPCEI